MKTFRLKLTSNKFHSRIIYYFHSDLDRQMPYSFMLIRFFFLRFLRLSLTRVTFRWGERDVGGVSRNGCEDGVKSCGVQLFWRRWSSVRRLAPYRGSPSIMWTGSFFVYGPDHLDTYSEGPLELDKIKRKCFKRSRNKKSSRWKLSRTNLFQLVLFKSIRLCFCHWDILSNYLIRLRKCN